MERSRLHIIDVRGAARRKKLAASVIEQLATLSAPWSEGFRRRLDITDPQDSEYLRSEVLVMIHRYLSIRGHSNDAELLDLVWSRLVGRVSRIAARLSRAGSGDRDFLQDCYRAVFEALRDPMHPQVDFWEANFYTACQRRCLDMLRQSRDRAPSHGEPVDPPDPSIDVEVEALQSLDLACLDRCIEQLSVRERDFCTQWLAEEATSQVLAQVFDVSDRTIRNWKNAITQKLHNCVNGSHENM